MRSEMSWAGIGLRKKICVNKRPIKKTLDGSEVVMRTRYFCSADEEAFPETQTRSVSTTSGKGYTPGEHTMPTTIEASSREYSVLALDVSRSGRERCAE